MNAEKDCAGCAALNCEAKSECNSLNAGLQ